jgi:hypothetical protein
MSFQAAVGTWLAAHLITDMPVGGRFGLMVDARPIGLQFETGDALDDVVLRLTDGGAVYVQCKTRPGLETRTDSVLYQAFVCFDRIHGLTTCRERGGALVQDV